MIPIRPILAAPPPMSPEQERLIRGIPVLRLGFRPFYLAAAAMAVALMALWYPVFTGRLAVSSGLLGVHWHAHEMIFGVIGAVVVGFLLTAGQAWTGLKTPRGAGLATLVGVWFSGRVAGLVLPGPVFALVDGLFLPVVAALFTYLIVKSSNRRNLVVAVVLSLLAVSNLFFHLAWMGWVQLDPVKPLHAGLALLTMLEMIIGGRIIPMFTMNVTRGLVVKDARRRDWIALVCAALGLGLWLWGRATAVAVMVLLMASILHAWRLLSWSPWVAVKRPILLILHVSYAWVPVGLALLALSLWTGQAVSPAVHALAVGATGGLVIAMITRTARGHTGRLLETGVRENLAYVLVMTAAVLRVGVPLVVPTYYNVGVFLAGALWALAFALYLSVYVPWLCAPRADGKDG